MKKKWSQSNTAKHKNLRLLYSIVYRFAGRNLVLSGDGRCDSPGSSAKFCTYTLMEEETGTILHMEHINKTEVFNKSPNMEREALRRSLEYISCTNLKIVELTTDASTSIISMMGECSLKY